MNRKTAHMLNQLTSDFYARNAESFSSTRTKPWAGWKRCAELLIEVWGKGAPIEPHSSRQIADDAILQGARCTRALYLQLLDMGCGNLRFETFLSGELDGRLEVWGVDNCEELVGQLDASLHFQQIDIVSTLLGEDDLAAALDAPTCDIAVAFGLMHHIPGKETRLALLDALLEKTAPGGLAMLTLWQFERDERLLAKARAATAAALERYPQLQLGKGDWLLGWQDEDASFRYCHSFDDEEVGEILEHASTCSRLIERFQADGKSNDLNCYLVFERR